MNEICGLVSSAVELEASWCNFFLMLILPQRKQTYRGMCTASYVVIALFVKKQMCSMFSEAKIVPPAQDPPQWALFIAAFHTQKYSTPKLGLLNHCCKNHLSKSISLPSATSLLLLITAI